MKKRIVQYCLILVCSMSVYAAKSQTTTTAPRDRAYDRTDKDNLEPLPYTPLRQADVFYEKRVWRVIDVREKQNLPFKNPVEPFIKIIIDGINSGEMTAYGAINIDSFGTQMTIADVNKIGAGTDTIDVVDTNGVATKKVVNKVLDYNKVTKFRLKEDWIFDKQKSMMLVRILGIEPILDVYNEDGSYRGEAGMFWIYYPDIRKTLVKHEVFNSDNDAVRQTWDDLFESRSFSSYIYKISNVYDRRIQDYATGIDALLEADRIKNNLINFEQEMWSY